jgi:hypothetical protein
MKPINWFILFWALVGIAIPAFAGPLETAIQQVETGGERNPSVAVGDHGLAKGWLQIHPSYYTDALEWANRHGKSLPSYEATCKDKASSEACMAYYWARYGAKDNKSKALLHHYGPNWRKLGDPDSYWAKVQKAMK